MPLRCGICGCDASTFDTQCTGVYAGLFHASCISAEAKLPASAVLADTFKCVCVNCRHADPIATARELNPIKPASFMFSRLASSSIPVEVRSSVASSVSASPISESDGASPSGPTLASVLAAVESSSRALMDAQARLAADFNSKFDAHIKEVNSKFEKLILLPTKVEDLDAKVQMLTEASSNFSAEFGPKVNTLVTENAILKGNVTALEHTCARLAVQNSELSDRLGHVERNALSQDLSISGVPELENENLTSILRSIAALLAVDLSDTDVREVYRLERSRATNKPRSIMVHLRSTRCRNRVLAAKRAKGSIYAYELGLQGNHAHYPVYVNEHLTPSLANLVHTVRDAAKKKGYSYVWTWGGVVHVKRDASSNPIVIRSAEELYKLASDGSHSAVAHDQVADAAPAGPSISN